MSAFDFICQNREGDYLRGECSAATKDDLSHKLARAHLFLVWWTPKPAADGEPEAPSVIDELWMRPINTREVMQLLSSGKTHAQRHELARPIERARFRSSRRGENLFRYGLGLVVWLLCVLLGYAISKPDGHITYDAIPPGFIAQLMPLRPGMRRADVEKTLKRIPGEDNTSMETNYAGPPGMRALVVYDNRGGPWSPKNVVRIAPGIHVDKKR